MSSPGHRSNILNENLNYIGVGFYQDGTATYWVQLFIGTEGECQEDSEDTQKTSEEDGEAGESPVDDSTTSEPDRQPDVPKANQTGESGNIQSIEIAQVMGKGLSIDDGEFYNMQSFVAGKNTAILVSLKEPVTVDPSGNTQYITISKTEKFKVETVSAEKTNLIEFLFKSLKDVITGQRNTIPLLGVAAGQC